MLGSIGIAIYRGQLSTGLPADVSAAAAEAARDTFGAAIVAATPLPPALGRTVVAALIRAVLVLGVAGLVVVFLRDDKPPTAAEESVSSDGAPGPAPRPTFTNQPEA